MDINDLNKLKNILGNAKNIIKKVETNSYSKGHIDERAISEEGIMEMQNEGIKRPHKLETQFDETTITNSKLPEAVKEAMLKNPIHQMPSAFSLDDVSDMIEEKPMIRQQSFTSKRKIQENINDDMITISKVELTNMVNDIVTERIVEFFTKSYNKIVTEQAVKKTVNLLLKEGKLPSKK